ncbi:MAG TPA: glycosyl hydrolase [Ohtaekwangia sp.]|nr:glycosyl hydrolase [Ohtaekwangia sp.]
MKKALPVLIRFLVVSMISVPAAWAQVDPDASEKTVTLYENLKKIQNGHSFLFGQEFFNSFRFNSGSAHGDKTYSDSHAVTGAHPAVLGSDFHYYIDKSETERTYHTEAVKWAYQQGYAITFDWHISAMGTTSYESGAATTDLVNNIVGDESSEERAWLLGELDKVIDIINNDLVVDGERIPIVFRPWHEMNGGWFWWGSSETSALNYKLLYQLTVDYIRERTNTVLFCWSPNTPTNFDYYPGDDYVDVLGLDIYELTATSLRQQIAPIIDHAQEHDKVAVLSETGNRTADPEDAAGYWFDTVLPAIKDDPNDKARKIAWVLTWINSSWSYPYVAHSASPSAAKQSFVKFKESPYAMFGNEIQNMYTPWIITDTEDGIVAEELIRVSPVPTADQLIIRLFNLKHKSDITIYDITGRIIHQLEMRSPEETFDAKSILSPGIYVLRATISTRTVSKKFIVE